MHHQCGIYSVCNHRYVPCCLENTAGAFHGSRGGIARTEQAAGKSRMTRVQIWTVRDSLGQFRTVRDSLGQLQDETVWDRVCKSKRANSHEYEIFFAKFSRKV